MTNYISLVSKVLANESLASAVNDLVDEHCLNLVTKDWRSRLENNITYQNYSSHFQKLWKPSFSTVHCECEESKQPDFQVVLVANCKFIKPYKKADQSNDRRSINLPLNDRDERQSNWIVVDSEPLTKIARAMTSDLGSEVNIWSDFKFSFVDCGYVGCSKCSRFANVFAQAGYKVDREFQPCILDTRVFTGESVVNRFYSQIENLFTDTFLAILKLEVNVRYHLKKQNAYRISGRVLDFVGFTENKLRQTKKVDLGPLIQFEDKPEFSSIKDDKPKNTSSYLKSKDNNYAFLQDFEDFAENDESPTIEEKAQSSNNRKRKQLSDVEDELENETKKHSTTEMNEYEIESFLLP